MSIFANAYKSAMAEHLNGVHPIIGRLYSVAEELCEASNGVIEQVGIVNSSILAVLRGGSAIKIGNISRTPGSDWPVTADGWDGGIQTVINDMVEFDAWLVSQILSPAFMRELCTLKPPGFITSLNPGLVPMDRFRNDVYGGLQNQPRLAWNQPFCSTYGAPPSSLNIHDIDIPFEIIVPNAPAIRVNSKATWDYWRNKLPSNWRDTFFRVAIPTGGNSTVFASKDVRLTPGTLSDERLCDHVVRLGLPV